MKIKILQTGTRQTIAEFESPHRLNVGDFVHIDDQAYEVTGVNHVLTDNTPAAIYEMVCVVEAHGKSLL